MNRVSQKLRIAVIYGGDSPEHEVSIITAVQAMAAIPSKFEAIPLYVTRSGDILTGPSLRSLSSYQNLPLLVKMTERVSLPSTPKSHSLISTNSHLFLRNTRHPFDILFPCFHGGIGEGGWVQGLAEFYHIPIVGTGLTGAALGMDKVTMKTVFAGAGIPQSEYIFSSRYAWKKNPHALIKQINQKLTYPLFVKPSRGGSSIGTTKVKTEKELRQALDLATSLDTRIVVESGIENAREINISVMGNANHPLEFSVCEEVFHKGSDFLNFSDKYLSGDKNQGMSAAKQGMARASRVIPAKIPETTANTIRSLAANVFDLLDCAGLVRIDFLVRDKDVYVIEVNTIPGSLSYYLWEKSGYSYPQLLTHLIELALSHHQETENTVRTFTSSILDNPSLSSKLGVKLSR